MEAGSEREIRVQEMCEGALRTNTRGRARGKQAWSREKTSCDAVSVEATANPSECSKAQVVSDLNPM